MAQLYKARPSQLAGIDDPYAAWCLDEAITEYTMRRRGKQRLKPPETTDNAALIAKMARKEQSHDGRGRGDGLSGSGCNGI